MPTATNAGVELHYETAGEGPPVALLGDVGFGAWQWGWQHRALAGPYRTVVLDWRGSGRSDAPPGPCDLETLAADVEAVLRDAGVRGAHLVGAGLGGAVALALALSGSRARSLTVVGAGAHAAGLEFDPLCVPPDDEPGLRRSLAAALSDPFRERHPDVLDQIAAWRGKEDAAPDAWRAQRAALEGFDVRDRLYEVTDPALVVHGAEDAVWPPERGAELASGLPRGRHREVPDAGHLVHVEASRVVNDALLAFLADVEE